MNLFETASITELMNDYDVLSIEEINGQWYVRLNNNRSVHMQKNGAMIWWQGQQIHREDGPAVECTNGNKSYYLNDNWLSPKEYKKAVKQLRTKKVA